MSDYEKLKKIQQQQGSALTCSFKKNGDVLIYISPNADNDEITKSLLQVTLEIAKHKEGKND